MPVLIVLDPTPSNRLTELTAAFEAAGGEVHTDDAWSFVETKAGECMSTFIEKYLRPILTQMTTYDDVLPSPITLTWESDSIGISSEGGEFKIQRIGEQEN